MLVKVNAKISDFPITCSRAICHLGIIVIIYIWKSIYYQIYGIICPCFLRSIISPSGTAREHVIGKSEILNILSCEKVFIAVENWMARGSRTSGLISPQNENL